MSYRRRVHIPGGMYYVASSTKPGHLIFRGPDDYNGFEEFLPVALEATGAKLVGYCWLPDSIHLVLKIGRRPVAHLMRQITRYCAQRMRKRSGIERSRFTAPLRITRIDPDEYVPRVIQYLHHLPILAGLAARTDDYPYTSHFAYLGHRQCLRVHTKHVFTALRDCNLH